MQQTAEQLANLDSSALLNRLDYLREQARESGYKWAEAEKAYNDLKELMPSFLAEFIAHYSTAGVNTTTARNRALADKNYQAKVIQMNVAEHKARLEEVEYKSFIESIKALTAISYVRNREMQL